MALEVKNPGFISKITNTSGVVGTQLVDSSDHIHTGLIKILSQQSRGNFAIGNGASSSDMGFKITQTTSSGTTGNTILTVTAGKIFRDGKYETVPAGGASTVFTAGSSPSSFQEPSSGSAYFLLVADSSNVLQIRGSSSTVDKVPDYTAGDTIIALIKMNKDDSNKENRFLQYLTTDKTANSLSIGYANSNAYEETLSVTATSTNTSISSTTTGAGTDGRDLTISAGSAPTGSANQNGGDLILNAGGGDGTGTSIMTFNTKISGTDAVAERMRIHTDGSIGIGTSAPNAMLHLKTATSAEPEIRLENTNTDSQEACIRFMKNSGDAANGDDIGIIRFEGDNSADANHLYAYLMCDTLRVNDTEEAGQYKIYVSQAGGQVQYASYQGKSDGSDAGDIIFNPANADIDFRIDGDTNDNLVRVDAANERMGIGTGTPDRKLHSEIEDSGTNTVLYPLRLTRTSSGTVAAGIGAGMEFEIETTAGNHVGATIEAVTTDVGSGTEDVDLVVKTMLAGSAANEALRIHDDGNLTVAGDLTVTGNDITFGNGATIVNNSASLLTLTEATVTASAALTAGTTITAGTVCTGATGIATGGYIQGGYDALTAHATNHAAGLIEERLYVIIGSGGVSMQLPAASANAGKIVTYHNSIAGVTQLVPKSGSGDTFNGGIDPTVIATADRGPAGGAAPPNYMVHIGANSIALDQGQTVTLMAVTDAGSMPATGWYILS